jgi:hypothetical protein
MVHIAMQQNDQSGSPATWGRHVTDEQYGASLTSAALAFHAGSSNACAVPKLAAGPVTRGFSGFLWLG